MTASIEISDIKRTYGSAQALAGVSLAIAAGEYCVLLGPSGCGKTTLLNIIGGFADPTSGQLTIGGKTMIGVPAARRPTTTVFQDYALFPHMSLLDNVSFGLRMRGIGRSARYDKARAMLDLVGLHGADRKRPSELSGGQRQRVALARALAVDPDVLLLDEPLGALDLNLRRAMQEELKSIQKRVGATFVHVTHDQEEAMAIADRIVVMNNGLIEDQGAPERVYRQPATRFVASFLGETNFIPAFVQQGHIQSPFGQLGPTLAAEGTALTICIRPEHISPQNGGQGVAILGCCTVSETTFQGIHRRIRAIPDCAPQLELMALLPVGMDATPGDRLNLTINLGQVTTLPGALT